MICREAIEFMAAYLAHELPADQRAAFDRHIAGCVSCIAYLESYATTIRLARGSAVSIEEEPPQELVDAILAALKK